MTENSAICYLNPQVRRGGCLANIMLDLKNLYMFRRAQTDEKIRT